MTGYVIAMGCQKTSRSLRECRRYRDSASVRSACGVHCPIRGVREPAARKGEVTKSQRTLLGDLLVYHKAVHLVIVRVKK